MIHQDWFANLLAAAALEEPVCRELARRLAAPERHYHGRDHVALLWSRHCEFGRGSEFQVPQAQRLIASTIAFHDAIHDPERDDNEARSALLWRARAAGLPAADVAWVADTIVATADHLATGDAEAATPQGRMRLWVLDLDLTPLGETPAEFARNTQLLRAEQRNLDEASWNRHRTAFLRRFSEAPRIYRTPLLAQAFEAQARQNIAAELAEGE